jgi:uncharacterized protein
MDLAMAPLTMQLTAFEQMVLSNPVTKAIVERMPQLELPGCYLAAGALFQTVWNCLDGRDQQAGINDYDINYFDERDLSWDAEDQAIRLAAAAFGDIDAQVEVRNEARVHLWYEAKFSVACPPFRSTEAAISSFPSTSSCFGIRPDAAGVIVFAPFGFSDLFSMRTRPNPVLAPREVYETKTARWLTEWPTLTILPWPYEEPIRLR